MGFSSHDDFINEVTANGKFYRSDWNKLTHATTAQVAGEWYCLFHSTGNPTTGVLSGATNLSFQTLNDQVAGAMLHGGSVTTDTKHILNASGFSAAATSMPAVFMLVDLLGFYPMTTTTTTTSQATIHAVTATFANATDIITHTGYDIATYTRVQFTNSGGALPSGISALTDYYTVRQSATTSKIATSMADAIAGTTVDFTTDGTGTNTITTYLPRYTTGAGVQAFVTPTTVMGAGTPNISLASYTNSAGTTGHVTPATLPIGKTASPVGHISYSGTGAGKYGPFMPLQAGDAGVRSVQNLQISSTYTSGALSFVLCKPLLTLPMTTIGVAAERDLMNQLPSLPRVYDNACLAWLMYAGANTPVSSAFYGHVDFGWG